MNFKKIALGAAVAVTVTGCFFDYPDPTVDPAAITFNDRAVHDPSVIRDTDGTFYVFGSHLAAAKSTDLMQWSTISNGVDAANPLWSTIPLAGNQWTGIPGSWAADVIKLKDGKYHFYYSFCGIPPGGQCTGPRSYLGTAVSDRIDGPYVDQGIFLRSGLSAAEIAAGYGPEDVTSYNAFVMPNTIDPNVFYDAKGKLWLLYGSYSGGLFILEMDENTAKPKPGQGYGQHLAGGDHAQIEGGYMLYSPESRYYYLFMSFGGLAANDGYNIRIARSRSPIGPFLDAEGRDMVGARGSQSSIAPFGVKLMGGFEFASAVGDRELERGYLSPGHNSAYYDKKTKQHLLITHTRFPNRGEQHSIRVHEMYLNKDGWLVASPHRFAPIKGRNVVDTSDILGDYKLINLGKDINRTAKQSVYVTLNWDYTISGEVTGRYQRDVSDPNRIVITLEGIPEPFEGILQWQWNEAASRITPIFTAVSSKGVSLWGSRMETRARHEVLADVAAALGVPEAAKDHSLTLPVRGARGTRITWVSSNEDVIATDGTVTRPNVGEGDQVVMLTAYLTLAGQTTARTFTVAVPQRLPFNRAAQYSFENTLTDALGRLAAGTATGDRVWNTGSVGFDAGREGRAVRLNGSNGVRLPANFITNYTYTVSFWINPATITPFTTGFFGAVNEQVDPNNGLRFSTQWLSFLPQSWDGNTMLWSGSERFFDGSAGRRIPAGAWSHLAFAVNRGIVSVYIDGVQRFDAGTLTDFFTSRPGVFALGVNYWDLPFNGLLDELKVYEAGLSAAEIRALDIDHLPNAQLIASAATLLDLGDTTAVRADLELPRTGAYAAAVSWQSSNAAALSTRGKVARPGRDQPDADVTLTATISLNGEVTTKSFAVRVKSLAPPVPVAAYLFEDDLAEAAGRVAPGIVIGDRIFNAGGSVSYAGGAVGRALVLNGSSGVRLPDNLVRDRTYSISMWLNPTAATQFTTALFGWASDSSWISVVPRGPGGLQHTMLWSGTQWFDGTFNAQIPVGDWSHLVMAVNNGTLTLYRNGQLVNTMTSFPDVFTPAASTQFALGVNFWDLPYHGLVDQLKIYDEAIAPENVRELFAER